MERSTNGETSLVRNCIAWVVFVDYGALWTHLVFLNVFMRFFEFLQILEISQILQIFIFLIFLDLCGIFKV